MVLVKIHLIALGILVKDTEPAAQYCVLGVKGRPRKAQTRRKIVAVRFHYSRRQLFPFAIRPIRKQQVATSAIRDTSRAEGLQFAVTRFAKLVELIAQSYAEGE